MIKLGEYNTLTVKTDKGEGFLLMDDENTEVFIHAKNSPEDIEIDESIEVFVYTEANKKLTATSQEPLIVVGEFAYLKTSLVTKDGAFVDMGIDRNLFIPFSEQLQKMEEGKTYLTYMYVDLKSNRLAGSTRLQAFLDNSQMTLKINDEVDLILWEKTDIGLQVIVNNKHRGLVYDNEVYQELPKNKKLKGFIKNIREDNKLDVSLQKVGYSNVEPNAAAILSLLNKSNGFLTFTDKSAPETIKKALNMSKKTFKKAIGALYKQKLIRIESDGLHLADKK